MMVTVDAFLAAACRTGPELARSLNSGRSPRSGLRCALRGAAREGYAVLYAARVGR
jgi:hypothetical protein